MKVFIHGFLGDPTDWDEICDRDSVCIKIGYIDLDLIEASLPSGKLDLIGYSMGGRIAIALAKKFPHRFRRLIIVSSHLGLESEKDKKLRVKQDLAWITKLKQEGIKNFIDSWYKQPLFTNLTIPSIRYEQNAAHLIHHLQDFSIAKLDAFWENLPPHETLFVYGETDAKYRSHYERLLKLGHRAKLVKNAGHAVHMEQKKALKNTIKHFLEANHDRDYKGISRYSRQ